MHLLEKIPLVSVGRDKRTRDCRNLLAAGSLMLMLCGFTTGCNHTDPTVPHNTSQPVGIAPPMDTATKFEATHPDMSPQAKAAMQNELADMGRVTASGRKGSGPPNQ